MAKVTWADLFTDDPSLDIGRLVGLWPNTVSGQFRPIGMSTFGDIYFERPAGNVERLDVLEGGIAPVARNRGEFGTLMNTASWQEEALLSKGVLLVLERGLKRKPDQCLAFVPHPALGGSIDWNGVMVMSAYAWHSICSQLLDRNR